jgi:hypothetical protein
MKKTFLLFVSSLMAVALQAQTVSEQQARQIASEFYQAHESSKSYEARSNKPYKSPTPSTLRKAYEAPQQALYVFNSPEETGFVIIAGDERATSPILGWSDNGPFDYDHAPCGLKALLAQYSNDISRKEERREKRGERRENSNEGNHAPRNNKEVGPLLTTQWSQRKPYNDLCPVMNAGYMPPTGCVATAMAQIMNYWQWPKQGCGQNTNDFNTSFPPQVRYFTESHYDWDNMLNTYSEGSYTEQQGQAVAQLMADVGCSLNITYSSFGSATVIYNAYLSLVSFFGYSQDLRIYNSSWGTADPDETIRAEIDAGRPILMEVPTPEMSHAVVCDGYNTDGYYHLNYGWGGQADGYYLPTAIYGGESFSMLGHEYIIGIHPSSNERVLIDHVYYELNDGNGEASVVCCRDNTPESEECDVVIPEQLTIDGKNYKVTSFREGAFIGSTLSSISIPGTIKTIPNQAFSGVPRPYQNSKGVPFRRVVLNDGIEEIGDNAFNTCWELEELTMSKTIRRIGTDAFKQCHNLSTIGYNWGDQLEYVGDGAFSVCKNLSYIPTFPATTMYIGSSAFAGLKNIGWISFEAKGFTIGEMAFYQSGVSNASGLEGAAKIERGSGISLSGEFTVQPTCVYEEGALSAETVVLPAALESYDKNTIYCKGTFRVEEGNKHYASANGVLYSKDLKTIIRCPAGALNGSTYFTIPAGVKKLEPESMPGNLYYVTIPASVKEMDGAFSALTGMREVTCLSTTPTAISDNTFANIHEYGRSVLNVPFGSKQAYEQANEWKRFNHINETVAVTDKFCYSVSDEYGTAQVIGRNTEVPFDGIADVPASMTFQGKTYKVNGANLPGDGFITSLSLPETFTGYTGDFHGCVNLQALTLPNSIQQISNGSFKDCPRLASVTLGSGLEWILGQAFQNCTSLKSITIPSKVLGIEEKAFENCGLEKVTFLASDFSINEKAFSGCHALKEAPGLENTQHIGERAFSGCGFTGNLSFSSSLQSINSWAFENNDIATVTLPSTLENFSREAFRDNPNFHAYIVNGKTGDFYTQDDMLFRHSENWEDGSPINELTACPPMKKEGGSIVPRYDVVVPEGTNVIWAELGRIGVRNVTLPATLTELQYQALGTAFDLNSVTVKSTTPLEIDEWAFSPNIFKRAELTLYVPKGCISVYRAAPYWNQFPNILEYDPASVTPVTIGRQPDGRSYNLQGQRVAEGYRGIVVSNGRKVLVK